MPDFTANVLVLFSGLVVSCWLYGIACCQAATYFRSFPKDKRIIKLIVAIICFFDLTHQVLVFHAFWHKFMHRSATEPLRDPRDNWSVFATIIPTELCVGAVEGFFVMRLWILSEKHWAIYIPVCPIFVGWVHSIMFIYSCFEMPGSKLIKYTLIVTASSRTITDISVAAMMCYLLYRRRDAFVLHTASLLKTLLTYSLTTGALTSVFTVAYLILFVTIPSKNLFMGAYLVHEKIYVNALLEVLNSRRKFRLKAVDVPFQVMTKLL